MRIYILPLLIIYLFAFEISVKKEIRQRNKTLSVSDPIIDVSNYYYTAELRIGSGTYTSRFLIDTGSSAIWTGLTGCIGCS